MPKQYILTETNKFIDEQTAYQNLMNAVVPQAVNDYRKELSRKKRNPVKISGLEQWFKSKYFSFFTSINPDSIIKYYRELYKYTNN